VKHDDDDSRTDGEPSSTGSAPAIRDGDGGPVVDFVPREAQATTICNESNTSALMHANYAGFVRWNPQWGWLIWDGVRWRRDEAGEIIRLATGLGRGFRDLAANYRDVRVATDFFRWAKHCESEKGARAVLKLAEHRFHEPVESFDADPHALNFEDGTLDLRDGAMRPHDPADMITKTTGCRYQPGAPCPAWERFLEEVQPDPGIRAYLRRAVGYSLGGSAREQCFFVLHGAGCNGKSTFLDVLQTCIGQDYAAQADPRTFLEARSDAIRTDLARLRGVRFVCTVEWGEGRRIDEALVKALTGGDRVTARFLYKAEFQYAPEFKIWMATNHRPAIRDASAGMWRRVRLIPWTVEVPEDRRDRDLRDRLLAEREGILRWAVEGALEYGRRGLGEPPAVAAATRAYRASEDIVGDFLRRRCEPDPGGRVPLRDLYLAFVAEGNGEQCTQSFFGRRVAEKAEGGELGGAKLVVVRGHKCLRGMGLRDV